jgi:hypothetical protein
MKRSAQTAADTVPLLRPKSLRARATRVRRPLRTIESSPLPAPLHPCSALYSFACGCLYEKDVHRPHPMLAPPAPLCIVCMRRSSSAARASGCGRHRPPAASLGGVHRSQGVGPAVDGRAPLAETGRGRAEAGRACRELRAGRADAGRSEQDGGGCASPCSGGSSKAAGRVRRRARGEGPHRPSGAAGGAGICTGGQATSGGEPSSTPLHSSADSRLYALTTSPFTRAQIALCRGADDGCTPAERGVSGRCTLIVGGGAEPGRGPPHGDGGRANAHTSWSSAASACAAAARASTSSDVGESRTMGVVGRDGRGDTSWRPGTRWYVGRSACAARGARERSSSSWSTASGATTPWKTRLCAPLPVMRRGRCR